MNEKIKQIIDVLSHDGTFEGKTATVGFDGVIDSIVKAIKTKKETTRHEFFGNINQFAQHIASKGGLSCSIELKSISTKIGGNMPILANAFGKLGIKVNCLGSMGYPGIHPVFKSMSDKCTLHSVAEPGYCTAMEFDDGKIMLAQMDLTDDINWNNLKSIIGMDKLIEFFQHSDLIALVNWSEIINSSSIWENILREIIPYHIPNKQQLMCFDLSDCSRHGKDEIVRAMKMIEEFAQHYRVVLSLNENEARLLSTAINEGGEYSNLADLGESLYKQLKIDVLVIHPVKFAMAWDSKGAYKVDGFFVEAPKLSTGGGDNFNAGFCAAQLLGLDLASSLIMGNAASGFYVKNAYSPGVGALIEFLLQ